MWLYRHIEPDHLGSPRKVIDPSRGTALWDWPILGNAFGTAAANDDADGDGNATALNLRFPGQQYDAATGLHYNYFRDYDPSTGRYVESDPIGLNGGVSTHGYVLGRPITRVDPRGWVSFSAGLEGGFHIPGTGGMGSGSIGLDMEGRVCFQFQKCARFGMGAGFGGGPRLALGSDFVEGQVPQVSGYAEGGFGGHLGGTAGPDGVSATVGAGMEACGGIQVCTVLTFCAFDLDFPDLW